MVSLILPTFNEAANIEQVLLRAAGALRNSGEEFEIIVVDDDSSDGTAKLVESLQQEIPVRVLRRKGRLGLATAVVDGWKLARGDWWGVMDADLQHPPEALPAMLAASRQPGVDLVIASRRVAGGAMGSMPLARQIGSVWASALAAGMLPYSMGGVRDPMSGMFLIRSRALQDVRLDPTGYKILLEVLAKARYRKLVEVPYSFDRRAGGSSKLGPRQTVEYFEHLWRLASASGQRQIWLRYLAAGSVGVAVNLGSLYRTTEDYGWPPAGAVPAALQLALFVTFFLHQHWTFVRKGVEPSNSPAMLTRFLRYEKLCLPGAVLNGLATLFLASWDIPVLLAAALGNLAEHLSHFFLRVRSVWQIWRPAPFGEAGDLPISNQRNA